MGRASRRCGGIPGASRPAGVLQLRCGREGIRASPSPIRDHLAATSSGWLSWTTVPLVWGLGFGVAVEGAGPEI